MVEPPSSRLPWKPGATFSAYRHLQSREGSILEAAKYSVVRSDSPPLASGRLGLVNDESENRNYDLGANRSSARDRLAELPPEDVLRVGQTIADAFRTHEQNIEAFADGARRAVESVQPIIAASALIDWADNAARMLTLFAKVASLVSPPPNWAGADITSVETLADISREEGMPFVYVPGPATITALLAAENAEERRMVLTSRRLQIVDECGAAIGEHAVTSAGNGHAQFVLAASRALRDGHTEAAQALASNVIETLGRTHVQLPVTTMKWSTVVSKNSRSKVEEAGFRMALVLMPAAAAYENYHPGEPIPTKFSRHATAHGVSRSQYNEPNAVLAVMNAASLLCWLATETTAFSDDAIHTSGL